MKKPRQQPKPKSKEKFDYSKFDYHSLEYNIEKNLTRFPIDTKTTPFMERMQRDIIQRQSKSARRERIVTSQKLQKSEKERLEGFNRLIGDANRRLEINENLESLMLKGDCNYNMSKKMPQQKWEQIYQQRFASYTYKLEENLKRKIIQKEKESKNKEDKIVENINKHIKKASKEQISKIVNRLWVQSQKKKIQMETNNDNKENNNDSNNNNKTKPQQLVQSRYKKKSRTMNRFLFNTSNTSKKKENNSQNKSVKKTSLSLMKSAIDPESELSFLQNTNENIHITTNYLNTDTLRKKPYCKSESSNQTTGNKKVKNIRNVKYISDNFATKLVDNLFKTKKI